MHNMQLMRDLQRQHAASTTTAAPAQPQTPPSPTTVDGARTSITQELVGLALSAQQAQAQAQAQAPAPAPAQAKKGKRDGAWVAPVGAYTNIPSANLTGLRQGGLKQEMSNDPDFGYMNPVCQNGHTLFPRPHPFIVNRDTATGCSVCCGVMFQYGDIAYHCASKSCDGSQICKACARNFQGECCVALLLTKDDISDLHRLIPEEHTNHLTAFMAADLIGRGDPVREHMRELLLHDVARDAPIHVHPDHEVRIQRLMRLPSLQPPSSSSATSPIPPSLVGLYSADEILLLRRLIFAAHGRAHRTTDYNSAIGRILNADRAQFESLKVSLKRYADDIVSSVKIAKIHDEQLHCIRDTGLPAVPYKRSPFLAQPLHKQRPRNGGAGTSPKTSTTKADKAKAKEPKAKEPRAKRVEKKKRVEEESILKRFNKPSNQAPRTREEIDDDSGSD
jgi:hypothetical protein